MRRRIQNSSRYNVLSTRVSDEELYAITSLSEHMDMSISSIIREGIRLLQEKNGLTMISSESTLTKD